MGHLVSGGWPETVINGGSWLTAGPQQPRGVTNVLLVEPTPAIDQSSP
jgi:hypothetical protein